MEGSGGLFGMFGGDPEDLQKHLADMAEQMQGAQKVAWADNAINLAVQMTVACIQRLDLQGSPQDQAGEGGGPDPGALPGGGLPGGGGRAGGPPGGEGPPPPPPAGRGP